MENGNATSCLSAVRQCIFLMDGITMDKEMFDKKADEFAEHFVKSFGCEIIDKLDFFAPLSGKYWQFKYDAKLHQLSLSEGKGKQ